MASSESLNDALRDLLMCATLKWLLTEVNLTLQHALEITVSKKTATNDTREMHQYHIICAINKYRG